MQFYVSSELQYVAKFPSTLILNVHAQYNPAQQIMQEMFLTDPPMHWEEIVVDQNRFIRLQTGNVGQFAVRYEATVDVQYDLLAARQFDVQTVAEYDGNTIGYLFPSRYCQSDRLSRFAWDLFGSIGKPYDTVNAITDWIYNNVEYSPGTTNSETAAVDTITQRTGVCRDFAHLGIALCRSLNIPARYFTAYAYQLNPPDFHAIFEAYIGGRWMIFDATRLSYPNALVKIANGKDAADAAVASIFGRVEGTSMKVSCELVNGQDFQPMDRHHLTRRGVSQDATY